MGKKPVALTTFRSLWRELLPFVAVMKPASVLCWMCQQGANRVKKCTEEDNDEEAKAAALAAYSEHPVKARQEMFVYTAVCESSNVHCLLMKS